MRRQGFTLVEILVTIVIISILVGILMPTISHVRHVAKCTKAATEVKNLEIALKKYYAEYSKWPAGASEDDRVAIKGDLAKVLRGQKVNDDNPRKLMFMEFAALNSEGDPVNPFYKPGDAKETDYYYAKFDVNYDNVINGSKDDSKPPKDDAGRRVIVWTESLKDKDDPQKRFIRSW